MFVYTEIIDGKVYALADDGRVWCMRVDVAEQLVVIERVCIVGRSVVNRINEPRLTQFLGKEG